MGVGLVTIGGTAIFRASPAQSAIGERSLSFHHLHTGESLSVGYWADGRYIPEALDAINHILRDFRTAEVRPIDTRLLDLLYRVRQSVGADKPYQIISGYRSPTTNATLANRSGNVARRSLHLSGKAIDVRIPGSSLRDLRKAAVAQKAGGVGFYPKSNFVHLDVGRVRYW